MPTDAVDIAARRTALRKRMKAWRQALPAEERSAASQAASERLVSLASALVPPAPGPVALYVPLRGELSPLPLGALLAAQGMQLSLPVVVAPDAPLAFRAYADGDRLRRGAFGVQEPRDEQPLVTPALVIVPLLAFDQSGQRLGYGGGYYDRTLERLRAEGSVTAIGWAFEGQRVETVWPGPHDQTLDGIVTEKRVLCP